MGLVLQLIFIKQCLVPEYIHTSPPPRRTPSLTPSGNSTKLSSYFPYKFWPWRVPSTLGNFPVPSVGRVRIFSGTDPMHVTKIMNQNFFANLTYLMISRSIEGVRGIKP